MPAATYLLLALNKVTLLMCLPSGVRSESSHGSLSFQTATWGCVILQPGAWVSLTKSRLLGEHVYLDFAPPARGSVLGPEKAPSECSWNK